MGRWYDKKRVLAGYLEGLKELEKKPRERIVRDLTELIRSYEPEVLEEFILEFPLDMYRRRWYDKDPLLWLIFNGLQLATDSLLDRIVEYFENQSVTVDEYNSVKY